MHRDEWNNRTCALMARWDVFGTEVMLSAWAHAGVYLNSVGSLDDVRHLGRMR